MVFQAEEMRAFHVRMREWPPARLAVEGYALFNLIPSLRGSFFKSVRPIDPLSFPSVQQPLLHTRPMLKLVYSPLGL